MRATWLIRELSSSCTYSRTEVPLPASKEKLRSLTALPVVPDGRIGSRSPGLSFIIEAADDGTAVAKQVCVAISEISSVTDPNLQQASQFASAHRAACLVLTNID